MKGQQTEQISAKSLLKKSIDKWLLTHNQTHSGPSGVSTKLKKVKPIEKVKGKRKGVEYLDLEAQKSKKKKKVDTAIYAVENEGSVRESEEDDEEDEEDDVSVESD